MTDYPLFYKKDTNYNAVSGWIYNSDTSEPKKTTPTAVSVLKVVKATATASEEGNGPEMTIDNNPNTRFSGQGVGLNITFDLGGQQNFSGIEVDWYKANERAASVDLLIDDKLFATYVSDRNVNPHPITIPSAMPAKKISLINKGNTTNDWMSITGVKIYGQQLTTPVEPGGGGGTVEPPPTPQPSTGVDHFGSKMIYPTIAGGRVFNAPFDTGSQRTLNAGKRDGNSDLCPLGSGTYTIYPNTGELKMSGGAPRTYVYDSNRSKLFENVEVTCYYKRISGNPASYQGFEIGVRGEHELGGSNNARVYYARVSISGLWDRMKEDTHPNGLYTATIKRGVAFNTNTWYGMKLITRNTKDGKVKIEAYRDETDGKNGGTWVKMDDWIDTGLGGYPVYTSKTPRCGCHSCFARTDNATDFRIKKFTIREVGPI